MRDNNVKIILSESDEMQQIIKIVDETFPHLVESCRIKRDDKTINDDIEHEYNTSNTIFFLKSDNFP